MQKLIKKEFPKFYNILRKIKGKALYNKHNNLHKVDYFKENIKLYDKRGYSNKFDITNVSTYTEKMQLYKFYNPNGIKSKLADKFEVRSYVSSTIGEEYLIPIYGVYDSVDEIKFEDLPTSFVIKPTHGASWVIIVKDKIELDIEKAKRQMQEWLDFDYSMRSFEMHYKDIKPRILIEKYIETKDKTKIEDYKFLCFNGKIHYCWVDVDRGRNHKRNIYDLNWNLQSWYQNDYGNASKEITKPDNFDDMLNVVKKLMPKLSHVRVDLYNVDGKIYFGELTFSNSSGFEKITPENNNLYLGSLWNIEDDIFEKHINGIYY